MRQTAGKRGRGRRGVGVTWEEEGARDDPIEDRGRH